MKALISKQCGGSLAASIGILTLLTISMSGCAFPAVGRDYRRPDTPTAATDNDAGYAPLHAPDHARGAHSRAGGLGPLVLDVSRIQPSNFRLIRL